MKILLTNDDGIEASGLWELHRALPQGAEPVVVAPASEQSGKGASVTLFRSLFAIPRKGAPCDAWSVEGTPADCVRIAIDSILPSTPDLILSGINPGSNAGHYVFSSGTVGGVIAGALLGIPGIAFSCVSFSDPQFARFSPYVRRIIHYATKVHPIPKGTILNVNFPEPSVLEERCNNTIAGIKVARQGSLLEEAESDVHWLEHGYITIVPVFVAELTHWDYLAQAKELLSTECLIC